MLDALQLDSARECDRIVSFIRNQLAQANYSRVVLGLSGGIDSALVAALCARALGPEHVLGVMLPYRTSLPESEAHARLVSEHLGTALERVDITAMVQPLLDRFPAMDARRQGNVMARCRMIVLYDQSSCFCGLVAGTSNRTETLLGYFTMHGDGAAALKPIAHLYKCQVRQLSRYLDLPAEVIDKAPSADLWQGQTDEGELGFSYDDADQILYLLTERGLSLGHIAAEGFTRGTVEAVLRRMASTAFKRRGPAVLSTAHEAIDSGVQNG
ncbi:MAG: NAD+ synthase [Anaerolineae bacterium]